MTEKPISPVAQRAKALQEEIWRLSQREGRPVQIMAVTKTVSPEIVTEVAEQGITLLGENRVQEFLEKRLKYPRNCSIHFIGTLQTNKVKYLVDKVDMIQSVDSISLAKEIEKRCAAIGRVMDILVEVNIAQEPAKSGVFPQKLLPLLLEISQMPHVKVRGLMTIGPVTALEEEKRICFRKMHEIYIDIQNQSLPNIDMSILSMGMSADYAIAIQEGATLVRLGTALFGKRSYLI